MTGTGSSSAFVTCVQSRRCRVSCPLNNCISGTHSHDVQQLNPWLSVTHAFRLHTFWKRMEARVCFKGPRLGPKSVFPFTGAEVWLSILLDTSHTQVIHSFPILTVKPRISQFDTLEWSHKGKNGSRQNNPGGVYCTLQPHWHCSSSWPPLRLTQSLLQQSWYVEQQLTAARNMLISSWTWLTL